MLTVPLWRISCSTRTFFRLVQTVEQRRAYAPWQPFRQTRLLQTQRILPKPGNLFSNSWKKVEDACVTPLRAAQTTPDTRTTYDIAPLDIGIYLYYGFHIMIPAGANLPRTRVQFIRNMIDYDKRTSLSIRSRLSFLDTPTELNVVKMDGTRALQAKDTKFKVTLRMEKGLDGYCTVQDMVTKQEETIKFDASRMYPQEDIIQLGPPS